MGRIAPLCRPGASPPPKVFPTGSTLLDVQNGGGWVLGGMVNVVGDSSSGKTLLAIEACANFARLYGIDDIRYVESEAAFDERYALTLGLPEGIKLAEHIRTAEQLHDDLSDFLKKVKGPAALYVLDSADALSDEAEMKSDIEDGKFRTKKAVVLSEMFRRQIFDISKANCCLFVISQIRDMISARFPMQTRSGGHALDFYAKQIVWLHEIGKEKRTALGVERVIGINVRARNKKNKIGKPFEEVEFLLLFNYGVDDELSMINWLKKNKADDDLSTPLERYAMTVRKAREARELAKLAEYAGELRAATQARWAEIQEAIRPKVQKYI